MLRFGTVGDSAATDERLGAAPGTRVEDGHRGGAVVENVVVPDHAVAEAIRRSRELDGHERSRLPFEESEVHRRPRAADARCQDRVRHPRADDLRQEVVHHDPLVVPAHQFLRRGEGLVALERGVPIEHAIDDPVVKVDEQQLQLRDNDVLVVARVADERTLLPVAGQVGDGDAILGVASDEQLHAAQPLDASD
jgi:hypothetical protein